MPSTPIERANGPFENGRHFVSYIRRAIQNEVQNGRWDKIGLITEKYPKLSECGTGKIAAEVQYPLADTNRDIGDYSAENIVSEDAGLKALESSDYKTLAHLVASIVSELAETFEAKPIEKVQGEQFRTIVASILDGHSLTSISKRLAIGDDTIYAALRSIAPKITSRLGRDASSIGAKYYPHTWPDADAASFVFGVHPHYINEFDEPIMPQGFLFTKRAEDERTKFAKLPPSERLVIVKERKTQFLTLRDEAFPTGTTVAETIAWAMADVDRDIADRLNPPKVVAKMAA